MTECLNTALQLTVASKASDPNSMSDSDLDEISSSTVSYSHVVKLITDMTVNAKKLHDLREAEKQTLTNVDKTMEDFVETFIKSWFQNVLKKYVLFLQMKMQQKVNFGHGKNMVGGILIQVIGFFNKFVVVILKWLIREFFERFNKTFTQIYHSFGEIWKKIGEIYLNFLSGQKNFLILLDQYENQNDRKLLREWFSIVCEN